MTYGSGTRMSKRQWLKALSLHSFFSQNCLGLKTDVDLTLLEDALNEKSGFAACLQETWRQGFENVLFGSWRFIGSGPEQQTGRGARGVRIALGYKAQVAWEHAGQPLWVESDRVLAVRLMVQTGGHSSGPLGVLLVSGYAPTSAHTEAEHSSYLAAMERALSHAQPNDIVVAGVDANASIG